MFKEFSWDAACPELNQALETRRPSIPETYQEPSPRATVRIREGALSKTRRPRARLDNREPQAYLRRAAKGQTTEVLSGERDPAPKGKGLFGLNGFGLVLLEKVELYAVETVKSGRTLGPDGFGFYAWLRNALPDATSTQDGFDEGLRNALPYDTSTQNTEDINIKKGEQFFFILFY